MSDDDDDLLNRPPTLASLMSPWEDGLPPDEVAPAMLYDAAFWHDRVRDARHVSHLPVDQILAQVRAWRTGHLAEPSLPDGKVIDARAAIRRDRVYESTAGPPRGAGNELAPELFGSSTGPNSCLLCDSDQGRTATLPASLKFSTGISPAGDSCAQTPGAARRCDLSNEDVADAQHPKTRS